MQSSRWILTIRLTGLLQSEFAPRAKKSVLRRASRISINPEGWTSSLKYHVFRVLDVINPGFGLVHASLPAEWTSESPCSERLTTRDFSRTRRVKDHAPAGLLVTGSCVTAP